MNERELIKKFETILAGCGMSDDAIEKVAKQLVIEVRVELELRRVTLEGKIDECEKLKRQRDGYQVTTVLQQEKIAYTYAELNKATGCDDDNRPLEALARLAGEQMAAKDARITELESQVKHMSDALKAIR